MEKYTYSISHTMAKISVKEHALTGGLMEYSIRQAKEKFTDHIVKEIQYNRVKEGCEDPVGKKVDVHRWTIVMVTPDEFIEGN